MINPIKPIREYDSAYEILYEILLRMDGNGDNIDAVGKKIDELLQSKADYDINIIQALMSIKDAIDNKEITNKESLIERVTVIEKPVIVEVEKPVIVEKEVMVEKPVTRVVREYITTNKPVTHHCSRCNDVPEPVCSDYTPVYNPMAHGNVFTLLGIKPNI